MRDALLRDLSALGYIIHTTVDARLTPPQDCNQCSIVGEQDDVNARWQAEMMDVDAVWLIAPETDGCLTSMTALALDLGKTVIGCDLASIQTFSNKLQTAQLLTQSNIACIPSYTWQHWPKEIAATWLAKPNDGVGCDDTFVFDSAEKLQSWCQALDEPGRYIIQPYLSGEAASMACIMHQGHAHVLSCNSQEIVIENNQLRLDGCIVNGMKQHWVKFEMLAKQIARLLPNDLTAYMGVDVIVNANGVTVVEINPRLTTSYVALARATAHNPAALILQLMTQPNATMPIIEKNVVEVRLNA